MAVELSHIELDSGRPIVILHGLFGSKRNWGAVAKALSARHRVLALDLRNHGESAWHDDVSYDAMGGKTAMTLALRHGELVERLVVVDIAPAAKTSGLHAFVKAMRAVPLAACKSRKDVENHLKLVVTDVNVRQLLMQNLQRNDDAFSWQLNLAALDAGMDAIHDFPDFGHGLAYKGPTKFITGGKSDYVQPHHMAEIHRLFPGTTVTPIPGASHWVHAEAPDAFLAEVWQSLS